MDFQATHEPANPYNDSGLDCQFAAIYEELRHRAVYEARKERHANLSPTTLLHEAWLKLKNAPTLRTTSNLHFKSIAAKAMQQVLVDEARRRRALKRGANPQRVCITLCDAPETTTIDEAQLLDLNDALEELRTANSRQAEIVQKHFFGELSMPEIAQLMGLSESTVERDWRVARAWLRHKLRPNFK